MDWFITEALLILALATAVLIGVFTYRLTVNMITDDDAADTADAASCVSEKAPKVMKSRHSDADKTDNKETEVTP